MSIRLVLADDHPIVLHGLEQLFSLEPDLKVVARCHNAGETLSAVAEHRPDILVLDVRMPNLDGLAVMRQLQPLAGPPRVVLLTAVIDEEQVVEAIRLGVRGIVLKEMAPEHLVEAIRRVHGGDLVVDNGAVVRALVKVARSESESRRALDLLTPRELEILKMVTTGKRNKEIGAELSITEGTVKIHLRNMYKKFGLEGRVELALFARDHRLA